jgi:hypothetical protein
MTREIKITPVLNGFVCQVGCQTVVFESVSELALNIERYYRNPDAVEKEFITRAVNKRAVNKTMDGLDAVAAGPWVVPVACDTGNCVGEARNQMPF